MAWLPASLLAISLASCGLFTTGPDVELHDRPLAREPGRAFERPGIVGAEDIAIDHEAGVAFVSCTDRWGDKTAPGASPGSLWSFDIATGQLHRADLRSGVHQASFRPHGISYYDGPHRHGHLLVISHRTGMRDRDENVVEVFRTNGTELEHVDTILDVDSSGRRTIYSLNDLAAIGPRQFFASHPAHSYEPGLLRQTWDALGTLLFGKTIESSVVFFDGSSYHHVATGLGFCNGVAVHPTRNLLYVSTSQTGELRVYDFDRQTGALRQRQCVVLGGMLDNMTWDGDGHLLVTAHSSLLGFLTHSLWDWDGAGHVLRVALRSNGLVDEARVDRALSVSGETTAGMSVAAIYDKFLFVGQVFRAGFVQFDLTTPTSKP